METQELAQAVRLFDTLDKWEAFIALSRQTENLMRVMTRTVVARAHAYFHQEHTVPGWSFKQEGTDRMAMIWYLTAFGDRSVCLVLAWGGEFVLEVRSNEAYAIAEATRLLQNTECSRLMDCFERIDVWWEGRFMGREKFNFSFGSVSDGQYEPLHRQRPTRKDSDTGQTQKIPGHGHPPATRLPNFREKSPRSASKEFPGHYGQSAMAGAPW
ncbi:hypothetical protein [Hymenobacter koreensis]